MLDSLSGILFHPNAVPGRYSVISGKRIQELISCILTPMKELLSSATLFWFIDTLKIAQSLDIRDAGACVSSSYFQIYFLSNIFK